MNLTGRRDYYAGALIVFLGLGSIFEGLHHPLGTMSHMGPGAFPIGIGACLVFIGLLIAAFAVNPERTVPDSAEPSLDLRGGTAIVVAIITFIVLADRAGLFPAAFATVFISALGDRSATIKSALILAIVIAFFGTVVFWYGLRIQLPLFAGWRS